MEANQPQHLKRLLPKKKNAKAATPAMAEAMSAAKAAMVNAVKAAAKDAMVSAAKAVMAAVVATAVASARVSVQASATSAQKARQPKPVSHVRLAHRAKAVATNAKANVMVNEVVNEVVSEVVSAQSAPRANAVTPCLHKVKLKARNRWPWTLPTTRWANAHHAANDRKAVAKVAVNAVKAVVSEAKAAVNVASVANLMLSAQKATSPRSLKAPCKK